MSEYILFLGCIIPARFPFMEKSTRLVLAKLGCVLHDLEGATCCPTKSIIKPIGEMSWYVTAARNLALAERAGHDLLVPCNGCYSTLKSVEVELRINPGLREEVNKVLACAGLEYLGTIEYETKMLCCGGNLNTADEPDEASALARMKLLEVTKKADALALTCPSCFMQYDSRQYLLQKSGEKLNVPILYYPELLGLAMGFTAQELGMDMHRIDAAEFLSKWDSRYSYLNTLKQVFDLPSIRKCYECGACVNDCPVVKVNPEFNPNEIIGKLLSGELEAVIGSHNIWRCVDCYTCYELCPQKMGMNKILEKGEENEV